MAITESVPGVSTPTGWRRIGRNSVWLLLARGLGQALGLVFALLVARNLGEIILGQFAFISTVLLIANMATNLGTDTLIIRQVATTADLPSESPQTAALLSSALLIQLGFSILVIVAVWLFAGGLPNQTAETLPAFRLISLSLIPIAISSVLSATLRGREHMGLYLIFTLVTAITLVLGAGLVVLQGGRLLGLAAASLVAQCAGLFAAIVLFRLMRPSLEWPFSVPPPDVMRGVVRAGLVLALLMTVTLVIGRLGTLMLSLLADDAATGWFSAAARLVDGLKLIPAAVLGALFPSLARRYSPSAEPATESTPPQPLRRMLLVGVLLSVVLALCVNLLAGVIIPLLYGPSYAPSIAVLRILVWSLPLSVVALSLSIWLVAAGQERFALLSLLPALALSAVLMAWLIARFGLIGASWGSVAAELFQLIALLAAMRMASRR